MMQGLRHSGFKVFYGPRFILMTRKTWQTLTRRSCSILIEMTKIA